MEEDRIISLIGYYDKYSSLTYFYFFSLTSRHENQFASLALHHDV